MNKRISILIAMAFCSVAIQAQTYDKVVGNNFWNDGKGYVGVRQDTVSVSVAEVGANHVCGGLRSSSDAASAWTAEIRTASIRHLDRMSLTGAFGFQQMWGKGMCGSMFVRPGFYPIDVYEFTPGDKTRQTYRFNGGVSVDVAPNWRVGGGIDFVSANYAKRKDLRHTTYLLDFAVKPGVMYHSGGLAVALNYVFSKNSETVSAEQVGSAVASYEAFLDKGLYYGLQEIWTGSGVHLDESGVNGLPVAEYINGISAQMSFGDFYFGVQWRHHSGKIGEKQKIWYRFGGYDIDADAGWSFSTSCGIHRLRADFCASSQTNNETVLEQRTQGGVITTDELGMNGIFTRSLLTAGISYEFEGQGWDILAGLSYTDKEGVVSIMYPYLSGQTLRMPSFTVDCSKIVGSFKFRLGLGWTNGRMDDGTDLLTETSGVTGSPERLDSYYAKYFEHMTSNKLSLNPSVRYNFCRHFYFDLAVWWQHGFEMKLLGSDRVSSTLKFGYNF